MKHYQIERYEGMRTIKLGELETHDIDTALSRARMRFFRTNPSFIFVRELRQKVKP